MISTAVPTIYLLSIPPTSTTIPLGQIQVARVSEWSIYEQIIMLWLFMPIRLLVLIFIIIILNPDIHDTVV